MGATTHRNRRNRLSDRGDNRALTSAIGTPRQSASATKFGQTSASMRTIFFGRITEKASRITGQKSIGLDITSIQGGAFLFAKANPVVVVTVKTQAKSDRIARSWAANLSAIATSPTLT